MTGPSAVVRAFRRGSGGAAAGAGFPPGFPPPGNGRSAGPDVVAGEVVEGQVVEVEVQDLPKRPQDPEGRHDGR